MAKLDVSNIIVDNYKTEEVISACVSMLKNTNSALGAAILKENLGLVGQQQGNLAMVQGILEALSTKLSGNKPINIV